MKKSLLYLVATLKARLLEFPLLVTALEKKDIHFMHKLLYWIKSMEDLFSTYTICEAAEIAGIRSRILAPQFIDTRIPIKKVQLKVASEVLYDLQHTCLAVLKPYEAKIADCRELVRQLLLIVSGARAIQYNKDQPFEKLIADVWAFILSSEQLKPGAIKLRTMLSLPDIHQLIAEEIQLEDF